MRAHDRASPVVRWIGNYDFANWCSENLEEIVVHLVGKHGMTREAALRRLARFVASVDREDTIKDYGPDHPEARA